MRINYKKIAGFTLIELLVVVSLINIFSSMVIVSINTSRAKAKDVVRMTDIRNMNSAIQQYILDNGHTPLYSYTPNNGNSITETNDAEWQLLGQELKPYLEKLPKDPCGPSCQKPRGGDDSFFAYQYQYGPQLCMYYNNLDINSPCEEVFRIFANNLESKDSEFGFGEGSLE